MAGSALAKAPLGYARAPILIVNDSDSLNEALRNLFERAGFIVEVATDGWDALTRLYLGLRPGLILLDLMMPVMDGYEFRQRQLELAELAEIPVVVMSAVFDVRSDAVQALQAKAYVEVPVDLRTLMQIICDHYQGMS
jgi:CheY-like chemotaxis protein